MPGAGDEVCEAGEQGEGRALRQKGGETLSEPEDSGGAYFSLTWFNAQPFPGAQHRGADGPW